MSSDWEDYARFLSFKDLYEKSKELKEKLEEIFPEVADLPYKTEETTTDI